MTQGWGVYEKARPLGLLLPASQFVPVVAGSTLKTGLVSFWEFETTSWTDAVVGSGNDLTGFNSPTSNTGKVGNAVYLTAASTMYLNHADTAALEGGQDFSIACWVYLTTSQGNMICSKYGIFNQEYQLQSYFTGSGFVYRFIVTNTGPADDVVDATTYGTPATTTWTFLAATYNLASKTLAISVNAGAQDTYVAAVAGRAGNSAFEVGSNQQGAHNWDGRIDQLGFWSKTLTTAEITQLYNGGSGLAYAAM